LITDVFPHSSAAAAGLKQGDIILQINGLPIDIAGVLRNKIALMAPGTEATLTLLRDQQTLNLKATIGNFSQPVNTGDILGLQFEDLNPALSKQFSLEEARGVVVTKMNPRSPAANVGICKGAQLLAIHQTRVETVEGALKTFSTLDKARPVVLLIKQGDKIRYVTLRINL